MLEICSCLHSIAGKHSHFLSLLKSKHRIVLWKSEEGVWKRGVIFCVQVLCQEANCRELSSKHTLNKLISLHVSLQNPYSILYVVECDFSLRIQQHVRTFLKHGICHLVGLHDLTETAVFGMCYYLFLYTCRTNYVVFVCEFFLKFWGTDCLSELKF